MQKLQWWFRGFTPLKPPPHGRDLIVVRPPNSLKSWDQSAWVISSLDRCRHNSGPEKKWLLPDNSACQLVDHVGGLLL